METKVIVSPSFAKVASVTKAVGIVNREQESFRLKVLLEDVVGALTRPDYGEHDKQLEFAEIVWFGNFFDYTEGIGAKPHPQIAQHNEEHSIGGPVRISVKIQSTSGEQTSRTPGGV